MLAWSIQNIIFGGFFQKPKLKNANMAKTNLPFLPDVRNTEKARTFQAGRLEIP